MRFTLAVFGPGNLCSCLPVTWPVCFSCSIPVMWMPETATSSLPCMLLCIKATLNVLRDWLGMELMWMPQTTMASAHCTLLWDGITWDLHRVLAQKYDRLVIRLTVMACIVPTHYGAESNIRYSQWTDCFGSCSLINILVCLYVASQWYVLRRCSAPQKMHMCETQICHALHAPLW